MTTPTEANPLDAKIKSIASGLIGNTNVEKVITDIRTIMQLAHVKHRVQISWAFATYKTVASGQPATIVWNDLNLVKERIERGATVAAVAGFTACNEKEVTVIEVEPKGLPNAGWITNKVEIEGIAHLL